MKEGESNKSLLLFLVGYSILNDKDGNPTQDVADEDVSYTLPFWQQALP